MLVVEQSRVHLCSELLEMVGGPLVDYLESQRLLDEEALILCPIPLKELREDFCVLQKIDSWLTLVVSCQTRPFGRVGTIFTFSWAKGRFCWVFVRFSNMFS